MENKYLAQAERGKVQFWRYILGIFFVVLGCGLFSAPYNLAVLKQVEEGVADSSRIDDFNYLMTLFDSNLTLIYIIFPFVGGLFSLYFVVKKVHQLKWLHFTTSRSKIDYKRVLFSFLLWGGVNAFLILLNVILNPEETVLNFDIQKFALLFVIAIVMIPIQTSFEEYLFRGYLMQGFGAITKTKWFPFVITSIAFGLMHLTNPEVNKLGNGIMVFYIGTGFLLGLMTLMDEGMELSLGFHAGNNLITALLVTTDWTAFQTHAIFKDFSEPNLTMQLLSMAILYPILIYILAKKYQWKNWKEKLI